METNMYLISMIKIKTEHKYLSRKGNFVLIIWEVPMLGTNKRYDHAMNPNDSFTRRSSETKVLLIESISRSYQ